MIYLDNAATSLQKPPEVTRAMSKAVTQCASPGRGGHRPAQMAEDVCFRCREAVASLFHVPELEHVVFTSSASHSLNIAIRSLVQAGDTVVISAWEHNAVTRTLQSIPNVSIRVATAPLFDEAATYTAFYNAITDDVKAVIFTHISNVFGFILPVYQLSALCRMKGIPFIIDASQSAGCIPINAAELSADYIAMPGHKGLFGPQGTGILLCQSLAAPLITGGTGSESLIQDMPPFLPDRLEAGTHNVPGIAGLLEGVSYVRSIGENRILSHERTLLRRLVRGLTDLNDVTLFKSENASNQSGVLSITVPEQDCEELGYSLGEHNICVRAGLHCAPLAHSYAGTLSCGTLRISVSPFNTAQEIDKFLLVFEEIVSKSKK